MTEKRFLLMEQFVTLSGITFIKDDDAEVDMYYTVDSAVDLLNDYAEGNEQLKQRNQRQAKHLAELYELMAKKDWEALTRIIDDLCSCEEQLQREEQCYYGGNVE